MIAKCVDASDDKGAVLVLGASYPVGKRVVLGDGVDYIEVTIAGAPYLYRADRFKVSAYLPDQFPKPCRNCGRVYQNAERWCQLGAVGQLTVAPDAEEEFMPEGYVLESRNCTCGDTLSVHMELPKP